MADVQDFFTASSIPYSTDPDLRKLVSGMIMLEEGELRRLKNYEKESVDCYDRLEVLRKEVNEYDEKLSQSKIKINKCQEELEELKDEREKYDFQLYDDLVKGIPGFKEYLENDRPARGRGRGRANCGRN